MPIFFLPFADSQEQAERVYATFQGQNPYPAKSGRLFRVSFLDKGSSGKNRRVVTAEVGVDFVLRGEDSGPVLAIIDTPNLVTIHTQLIGGLSATPILVSPNEVTERVYFDDFMPPV